MTFWLHRPGDSLRRGWRYSIICDTPSLKYWLTVNPITEPDLYEYHMKMYLSGILHWENDLIKIHGRPLTVKIVILDRKGNPYNPIWDGVADGNRRPNGYIDPTSFSGNDFFTSEKNEARASVHMGAEALSSMVSDVLLGGWGLNRHLQITIREEINKTDEKN